MVEEKRKRGRPKKIKEDVLPGVSIMKETGPGARTDQSHRRDELVVQMVMGIINKSGSIKYDFAKDLFNTATELAYDFGWMERPKEKKQSGRPDPLFDDSYGVVMNAMNKITPAEALANTPADIFRQIRGDS